MSVERFIEIAASAVELHAGDAVFRALIGPGEMDAMQVALANKSTCALFVRGCLATCYLFREREALDAAGDSYRRLKGEPSPDGCPPRFWAPYVDGMAVADLVAELHHVGRDPGRITRGSVVIVGEGPGTHVFIVESVERDGWPDGSYELTAIEAGQRDAKGRQCVVRRRHEIVAGMDRAFALLSSARAVSHVLDPRPLLEGGAA